MARWDSKKQVIVFWPAKKWRNGWWIIDCGCCGGLEWGGEYPRICDRCKGGGIIWWHEPTKTFALYPGGPLRGRGDLSRLEREGGEV